MGTGFQNTQKIRICEVSHLTEIIQTTQKVLESADQQTRTITKALFAQETGLKKSACHQARTNGSLKNSSSLRARFLEAHGRDGYTTRETRQHRPASSCSKLSTEGRCGATKGALAR